MRVISLNANGIRSSIRRGFFDWVKTQDPDFICLQETKIKAQECKNLEDISLPGYKIVYEDAEKRGYSGVAIFAKKEPMAIQNKLGFPESDLEGRFLRFDYPNFAVISLYLPSGSSGDARQAIKMVFLDKFYDYLASEIKKEKKLIICGDWNIAHTPIDLKNWKSNQKTSGFLPQERTWLDKLFSNLGYIDAYRTFHPEGEDYSWWSMRSKAREKNVGWRIDYQILSPSLKNHIKRVEIIQEPIFSDHAPVLIDYEGLTYA